MSLLGGISPLSLIATAALGPIGGIVAQLAQQVVSQVGQQLLQSLGEKLGLPQSTIDMTKGAFCGAMGDVEGSAQNAEDAIEQLGQETGASPSDIGQAQGDANRSVSDFVSTLSEGADFKEAKASGKGGGWLMALAEVLGKELNKEASQMEKLAGQIDKDTPDLTAKFGAVSQQFGILMNATTTAIKTIGEAMANSARKG